jgi:hypothetical protein
MRRWKPGGGVPVGPPTSPLVLQPDAGGRLLVAYSVANRFLVCIDPDRDVHLWAAREEADSLLVGAPQPTGSGQWLTADLAGRVALFDGMSGKPVSSLAIGLPGAVPAAAASLLGGAVLTPLSDGSAVVLSLPAAPEVAPPPAGKQ